MVMYNRRGFLINTSAATAIGAISSSAGAFGLALPQGCDADFVIHEGCKPAMAEFPSTKSFERMSKVSWRAVKGPAVWDGDNVQMHTRFAPFRNGMKISQDRIAPPPSEGGFRNKAFAIESNAIVTNVEPQAVLVNLAKARAKGIDRFDLQGFAEKSVKPVFQINLAGYAPENAWLVPLLRSANIADATFLDECEDVKASRRLARLLESHFSHLELDVAFGPAESSLYEDLIDEKAAQTVAIYGDPIRLASLTGSQGNWQGIDGRFSVVSLQEFMKIDSPSFFASQMIQVGDMVESGGTDAALSDIAFALAHTEALHLATGQSDGAQIPAELQSVWQSLVDSHDRNAYSDAAELGEMVDQGVLTHLAIDLQAGLLLHDRSSPRFTENVARDAITNARMLRDQVRARHAV